MTIDKDFELTKKWDKQYCLGVFSPADVAFSKGSGVWLYDMAGNKYMDLIGGIAVNSLGHGNTALTSAISSQAKKLIHVSNLYYNSQKSELAYRLCNLSFADKCFFCNSGAEANEAAIKIARGYHYYKEDNRYEIITATMSFHGRTLATIAATGQEKFRKAFGPDMPGFVYVPYNDYDAIEAAITPHTAAIMLELIQGESGVHPARKEYIQKIRKLCTEKDILLIIDEVQTGIGRTGRMFCYENYGITPDIMTLAKGLGGGVPIGAMLCTYKVATGMRKGDHGSTFGGGPLACQAACTVLEQIEEKELLNNVGEVSEYLFYELGKLKIKYPSLVNSVRGMGFLIGIEFNEILGSVEMAQVLMNKGFLVSPIGNSTIRLAPPLILKKYEAKKFITTLADILKKNVSLHQTHASSGSTPKASSFEKKESLDVTKRNNPDEKFDFDEELEN